MLFMAISRSPNSIIAFIRLTFSAFMSCSKVMSASRSLPSPSNCARLVPISKGCLGVNHTSPSYTAMLVNEVSVTRPFFTMISRRSPLSY